MDSNVPSMSNQEINDLLYTIVLLCRGKDKFDRDFWAYLSIKPSKAEAFKQARESGSFCLADYGTILEAGEGTVVPEDVRKRMERDFGAKEDYEAQLLKAIEDIRNNTRSSQSRRGT